jgi:hypothetical protein
MVYTVCRLPLTAYQNKKAPAPLLVRRAQSAERIAFKDVEKKKAPPSRHGEVELSQRPAQLAIVSVMGRGIPLVYQS